jgi:hypothetical protein
LKVVLNDCQKLIVCWMRKAVAALPPDGLQHYAVAEKTTPKQSRHSLPVQKIGLGHFLCSVPKGRSAENQTPH